MFVTHNFQRTDYLYLLLFTFLVESGLEFAALAPAGVQIIFTTAHADYAVAGFDMAITDFLLKPINYNCFLQACTLALNRAENKVKHDNNTLFVKDGYKFVKIDLTRLLYVKADDNYLNLVEPDKQTLVRMTLQELSKKLPVTFAKVHKSYIVNTALIDHLERHQLAIGCTTNIPIAKPFLEELKKTLSISCNKNGLPMGSRPLYRRFGFMLLQGLPHHSQFP
jgi:two-component system LytT family response regulator